MTGNSPALKKSATVRWSSRLALLVSMLAASMANWNLLASGSAASSVYVPLTLLNRP